MGPKKRPRTVSKERQRVVSRRDLLRYGVSLAETSALSRPGMTVLASNDKAVTTFAKIAGAAIPQNRPVDGVDQTDFLLGQPKSNRDGFPVFVADRLEAVKWRNYKLASYEAQREWSSPAIKLGVPRDLRSLYGSARRIPGDTRAQRLGRCSNDEDRR